MIRDRLEELKKISMIHNGYLDDEDDDTSENLIAKNNTCIINISSNTIENDSMAKTLEKYARIKELLNCVVENTDSMKRLASVNLTTILTGNNFSEKMDKKREQNITYYQKITTIFKELEKDLPDKDDKTTISRMKFGLYHGNKVEIFRVWQSYTTFLLNYEEKVKKLLFREAEIVYNSITDEQKENILDGNQTHFFTGHILQDTQMATENLREELERHHELEKIEKSLREVRDMFVNMSNIVYQQGELIQSIEFHAQRALNNVDNGAIQLESARDYKIKALKKKTCILIWVTVILVVIVLILLFT